MSNIREQFENRNMQNTDNVPRRTSETPRPYYERNRLSECIEEEDENAESALSAPGRKKSLTKTEPPKGTSTRVGKFVVTRTQDPDSRNLHVDKKFIDDSLVEIRKPTDSSAVSTTEDYNIPQSESDDVWVKRSNTSLEKIEPKASSSEEIKSPTKTVTKDKPKKDYSSILSKPIKHDMYTHTIGYNQTNYNRRDSKDDPQMYQQTIHGTSGVSRRPALLGLFRQKPKEPTADAKKASFLQHVKAAFQSKPISSHIMSPKDGSAHPHGNSDIKYYHTVTAATSTPRRANPMHKVMDIFRTKPASVESTEQRNKRQTRNQQTMAATNSKLKRIADGEKDVNKHRKGTTWTTKHIIPDFYVDPKQATIVFRNSRGLPFISPFLKQSHPSDILSNENQIYASFLKFHKCYDLMPTSAKLIIFDTTLLVKDAFFALVYNVIRAAPLWDSKRHAFVGMLTITDFILILQKYYKNPKVTIAELELHKLETWRSDLKDSIIPLVYITPDTSLYEATDMLIKNRIHRLPVIDTTTGNVLYVLTHRCILRFLFLYIKVLPQPAYMNMKLKDLKIGTFDNIETVNEDTSVIDALRKFVDRSISALPLVDSEGKLKDIYEKFDVLNMVAEKTYDLDITLKQATSYRNDYLEGVSKCTMETTLYEILEKIVRAEVHRLVIVNETESILGIISLSDLLQYMILKPECKKIVTPSNEQIDHQNANEEKTVSDEIHSHSELAMNIANLQLDGIAEKQSPEESDTPLKDSMN